MAFKLLANCPTGEQQLIAIDEGGSYFDPSLVIWDERVDGAMPAITLGGMTRVLDALVFDQARMDQHLAAVRVTIWGEIRALRDRLKIEGGYMVVVGGVNKWFHSDTFSRTQQIGLARKADRVQSAGGDMTVPFAGSGPNGYLYWKTMDASFVAMTPALAQAVFDAAEAQDTAMFGHAEALKTQADAAADPGTVDLQAGWPAVFQA